MKIFLDFDDTIFCTKKFKRDYEGIFIASGIHEDEFKDSSFEYPVVKKRKIISYDYRKHLEKIKGKIKNSEYEMLQENLETFLSKLNRYIFKDFFDFIRNFKKKQLFLISFGNIETQIQKIKSSGVEKFFNKIKVTTKKKSNFIKRVATCRELETSGEIIFIDDRPDQVEEVKKALPQSFCFRIKRKEARFNDFKILNKEIFEVNNLEEAYKIIKKYHPCP